MKEPRFNRLLMRWELVEPAAGETPLPRWRVIELEREIAHQAMEAALARAAAALAAARPPVLWFRVDELPKELVDKCGIL